MNLEKNTGIIHGVEDKGALLMGLYRKEKRMGIAYIPRILDKRKGKIG